MPSGGFILRCLACLALGALEVGSSTAYVKAVMLAESICLASLYQHSTDRIEMPFVVQRGFSRQRT